MQKNKTNSEFLNYMADRSKLVGAIRLPEEQFSKIDDVLSLVLSLTDKKSRGIPYIIDIVDMKARVTNKKMKYLSESYITKNRFELLFHSQRDKRSM